MVYSIAFYPVTKEKELLKFGFMDSKQLKEADRDRLFRVMQKNNVGYITDVISAKEMSEKMLMRSKISLNEISHNSAIALIKAVQKLGLNVASAFVDTVGTPEAYQKKIERACPGIAVTVSKKADSKYAIVSAASIAAKVIRDFKLKNWYRERMSEGHNEQFGSGYPGDATTKEWLRHCIDPLFGFPDIVRFSWRTCEDLLGKRGHSITWTYFEEDEETDQRWKPNKRQKVESSPKKLRKQAAASQPQLTRDCTARHRFFAENGIDRVSKIF
eukprot:TRINITY_DN4097_c0_g4_i2.p1 TRINITY_DN4097_c0_g4~~TRINITY_DN4097_c0_g4_i2.p1  ORF type:complete len:272 (-),score=72.82 TRINITY_DN4097_c0_g4_i2:29-844(-)